MQAAERIAQRKSGARRELFARHAADPVRSEMRANYFFSLQVGRTLPMTNAPAGTSSVTVAPAAM